jgi:Flp pilus assembly protein TadD
VSLSLWLGVGSFLALLLVLIAVQANMERHDPPVEGSNADQQGAANAFRAAVEKDSTDTRARVGLADILFDTGNWSEAIVHYRSAVRHDSSLVTAIVDQGVCYYNLSQPDEAERLFRLALAREPHQPFALFNMGIISEHRGDTGTALEYFHRALESAPPENMKPALMEAMQRVAQRTGKQAPPLDAPPGAAPPPAGGR